MSTGKLYNVIYADPPWAYEVKKCGGSMKSGAASHYPTMSVKEMCALPVAELADKDCALFMWATMPKLEELFCERLFNAWGFNFKTCAFAWIKQNKAHDRQHPQLFFPTDKELINAFSGMGRWTRQNVELCLLGTRGKPKRQNNGVQQVIFHPLMRHSKKPQEARDRIVRLMGDVPRVELFAREKVSGWDSWGNEVESDIELSPSLTTFSSVEATATA